MSGISGVNDKVDWTSLIGQINTSLSEKATDGTSGSVALSGDNLVITLTSGDGTTQDVELPVTTDMSLEEAQQALADFKCEISDTCDALASDLETIAAQLETENGVTASSTGSTVQKLLFDIYELIKLLREVAQEQRDNAREIRETELQTQLSAIQSQADYQMKAAVAGMVVGTILCATQVVIAAVGAGKSIADMKAADNCAAAQEIKSAENRLQTMKLDSAASMDARINELGGNLPKGTNLDTLNHEIETKMEAAKSSPDVVQAQNNLTAKETAVTEKQAEIDALQGQIENLESMEQLNALADDPIAETTENLNAARIELATKQGELVTAKTEVETAQTTYNQTLAKAYDGVADEYEQKCSPLATEAKSAEKAFVDKYSLAHPFKNYQNGSTMEAAQGRLGDAYATADYVRAKVIQAKNDLGCSPTDTDLNTLETTIAAKTNALSSDRGYRASMNNVTSQLLSTVPNMLTGTFQGITSLASATGETAAKLEEAVQKESEADRQMTQELFDQALDVVKDAKSLLQAVIQAENQSTEQIINA